MTQDLSSQYTQKTEKEKKQRKNGSNFWGALIQMKNYKSVTEYPPNLQWAICNLHSDSRRTFHLARLDLLGVNKRNLVSGLPHHHPIFTPEPPINAFICRLFLCSSKTQLVLHPSKSSCTSSSVRCISFDQKTMPVQMSISLSFNFHPYVAETPLQNRDALSFLASASILLSSLGLLGERSRCPTGKAYSHQLSVQPWYRTFQCRHALQNMAPWEMTITFSNRFCLLECKPGLFKRFLCSAHCRFAPAWLPNSSRPASSHTYIEPYRCGFHPQCWKQWGWQLPPCRTTPH